jgi:hypothetical protein
MIDDNDDENIKPSSWARSDELDKKNSGTSDKNTEGGKSFTNITPHRASTKFDKSENPAPQSGSGDYA